MLMYCDRGQKSSKLNSRPVYCSRLYGNQKKLCTYIWRSSICKKDLHFSGISHPSDHHDHRGSATKMINGGAAGNKFRTGQRQRMHLNDSRSQQPQQPQSLPPYPVSILPTGQMAYQF